MNSAIASAAANDLRPLLAPIDGPSPAGPDLEYEAVAALDRLGHAACRTAAAALQDDDAPSARWDEVDAQARALLVRTKDLRAALWFVHARLSLRGLPGLALGLQLLAGLLAEFGDALHPRPEAEDDGAATRLGLLLEGLWPDPARHQLTAVAVHFRALLLHHVDHAAAAPADAADRLAPVRAIVALQAIEGHFDARGRLRPAIAGLRERLARVAEHFGRFPSALATLPQPHPPAVDIAAAKATDGAARPPAHCLASREDAMFALRQAAEYLRRTEPSSPAPLFIERALRLMQMDFTAIVEELIPESGPQIQQLAGGRRAPPAVPSPLP